MTKRLEEIKKRAYRDCRVGFSRNEGLYLISRIESAEKMAEHYASMGTAYIYPEDWKSFKEGGPPEIDDYMKIDDIGDKALEWQQEG